MTEKFDNTCPMSQRDLIAEYFMEYRAQLLAVAAFLDRLDRSVDKNGEDDFRYVAFKKALEELLSEEPERVERVQMILSDQDIRLMEERDVQGAYGASIMDGKKETVEA